uniref:Uncharacterized protein ycf91 n=2 Tax=Pyropia yezoensis TaxID=2788 RepID=YCF91_PYRYE|nr:hypothetical protein 121 [Neopyropia yezoensis]Q1XDS0.1 RecName: Full=Uncharacterized protein ycf91 [Neopyropia yezoensis]AGH27541.1 hypothetical protein 121 [Neopyropia yezoensis]QFZ66877.1 hypothetical protein PyyePp031 [Neopyropia yezoensis]WKD83372.1 hypothetical protein [Neopyropia yezoensis]BAE92341.1 unnamed protein product [Neopyropia yezoensis]
MYQSINKLLLQHQKKYLRYVDTTDYSSENLDLDQFSYFIITINKTDKCILIEQFCYNAEGHIYSIFFKGPTAKHLSSIICHFQQLNTIISTAHAIYLGRELMKSELALVLDQQYIQD